MNDESQLNPLNVFAFIDPGNDTLVANLATSQITILRHSPSAFAVTADRPPVSVALIDSRLLDSQAMPDLIGHLRSNHVPIIVLADPKTTSLACLPTDSIDAIVWKDRSPHQITLTLWLAYRHSAEKRVLREDVRSLSNRISHIKLIGQAKAIVAEQLNISEAAALRHLRAEARNRRRPMHELASVVLEARKIIQTESSDRPADDADPKGEF